MSWYVPLCLVIIIIFLCVIIYIIYTRTPTAIQKYPYSNTIQKYPYSSTSSNDTEMSTPQSHIIKKSKKPVVYGLWIGSQLGKLQNMCLKSFLRCGYDVILYTYDHVKNIPVGIETMDANDILNNSLIYKYENSYAGFSDIFRYKLLYLKGGIWIDLDLFCLRPFHHLDTTIFSCEELTNNVCTVCATNPIKINKKHPLMFDMFSYSFKILMTKIIYQNFFSTQQNVKVSTICTYLQKYDDLHILDFDERFYADKQINFLTLCRLLGLNPEFKNGQTKWGEFMIPLTTFIRKYNMTEYIFHPHVFNPILYNNIERVRHATYGYMFMKSDIYMFNMYNTFFKKKGLDVDTFEPGSILHQMQNFLRPTVQVLLPTIGRKNIFRMLTSIKDQLEHDDHILIIFDNKDIDSIFHSVEKFCEQHLKCSFKIIYETTNLGYWGHGVRNKYKSFDKDFIFHIDDDDVVEPGTIKCIKETCISRDTIYIFKVGWGDGNVMPSKVHVKEGDIGTPNGLIPNKINEIMSWGLYRGGDGDAYEFICKTNNVIFVDKKIYRVRP